MHLWMGSVIRSEWLSNDVLQIMKKDGSQELEAKAARKWGSMIGVEKGRLSESWCLAQYLA